MRIPDWENAGWTFGAVLLDFRPPAASPQRRSSVWIPFGHDNARQIAVTCRACCEALSENRLSENRSVIRANGRYRTTVSRLVAVKPPAVIR